MFIALLTLTASVAADKDEMREVLGKETLPSICDGYGQTLCLLIPRWFDERKRDSMFAAMDFFESECGPSSSLRRIRLLSTMIEGKAMSPEQRMFRDSLLAVYVGGSQFARRWTGSSVYLDFMCDLTDLIQRLADSALHHVDYGTDDYVICMLLKHDQYSGSPSPVYQELRDTALTGTYSQSIYLKWVADLRADARKPVQGGLFYAGMWSPLGENKVLGNHIDLGMAWRMRWRRFDFGAMLAWRLIKSTDEYFVGHDDAVVGTDHFFGIYFGPEVGIEALRIGHHSLGILLGAGLDGFEAISMDDESEWISSWSGSVGLTYRWYTGKEREDYFGLRIRHYFINFDSHGGSDLSGNALSVAVTLGVWKPVDARKSLVRLGQPVD